MNLGSVLGSDGEGGRIRCSLPGELWEVSRRDSRAF